MTMKRVIDGVHVVPMGNANAYLIEGADGLTLVDAGFPNKEAAVFAAIRSLGRTPDQHKHLILTHGHPDHLGSAAAIVRETGARTYMHQVDIPLAETGGPFRPMTPAPGLLRQVLCRVIYEHNEALGACRHRRTVDRWDDFADRGRHRHYSRSWPLRGAGRVALAIGTHAVRGRCVYEHHGAW
jgi:glyoxylase-like metal-dependent hydrolase (beta-lactamase superfamily II)